MDAKQIEDYIRQNAAKVAAMLPADIVKAQAKSLKGNKDTEIAQFQAAIEALALEKFGESWRQRVSVSVSKPVEMKYRNKDGVEWSGRSQPPKAYCKELGIEVITEGGKQKYKMGKHLLDKNGLLAKLDAKGYKIAEAVIIE